MDRRIKLGILGSTRGTILGSVFSAIEAGELDAEVAVVISNKQQAYILERAQQHGVPAVYLSAKNLSRDLYDANISAILKAHNVDLVLLIGYMRILSNTLLTDWPQRIINVHPSLLPDFAGLMDLAVHQAVLDAGRKESGCSVHFVTEAVDAGPIVVQKRCAVDPGETAETLKTKIQQLEGAAMIEAIQHIQQHKVKS